MYELDEAIKSLNKKNMCGPDNSAHVVIHNVPDKCKNFLLSALNEAWFHSYVPLCWKHAIIRPLLKNGLKKTDIKSFWPISTTSSLCKIMEKIIFIRLT